MSRPVLQPTAEHPITVDPTPGEVTVTVGGRRIAHSTRALTLRESTYPPVQYIPLDDVDPAVLQPSDSTSYCPYKGEANYLSVDTGDGEPQTDVIWTYRAPYDAVAAIKDHAAFYPDRAEVTLG